MKELSAATTPPSQPIRAEPLAARLDLGLPTGEDLEASPPVAYVGRLRVPIAGPYRPWARLYRLPDRRLVWVVRLWDRDRAVRRVLSTRVLLEFARLNGYHALSSRVRRLDRRGRRGT